VRSDSRAKDGMDNAAGLLAGFLVLALSLAIYFIPTLVAFERLRRNRGAIFVLNLFLGWTLVGWVAALVWAWMNPVTAMAPLETEGRAPCPHCREQIIVTARLCRFCGIELAADWSRPLVPHRRSW
jgi:Superinfection immunity protein